MGFSRSARIITLLIIDTAFFFLELIVGYAVGSLALVADSFHMLNDVFSLIVALYTIKLATSPSSSVNSYGWQRAEILGALINGVFLLALCLTIALEAIGRIVEPPEISNAKLIVVVGSLGLASNIVGLFLFHDHGHSHGGHSHGAIALPADEETGAIESSGQNPSHHRARADSMSSLYQHPAQTRAQVIEAAHEYGLGRPAHVHDDAVGSGFNGPMSPPTHHGRSGSISGRKSQGGSKLAGGAKAGLAPLSATTSAQSGQAPSSAGPISYAQAAQHAVEEESESSASTAVSNSNGHIGGKDKHDHPHKHDHGNGKSGKMAKDVSSAEAGNGDHAHAHGHGHDHSHAGHGAQGEEHDHSHDGHGHGGHGHSHGSMNMHGVFLHVLGDALGNVGVIAAGLVIWFFQGRWTLYFDPAVSLLITCIIFSSALPLVKSASYILMQGVPSHVSLEAVRSATKSVPGVVSVHELHIWQLSETTVVASVHVMITPGVEYMDVASGIRKVMHRHGIHSVTIQPEFYAEGGSMEEETACLIRCPPEVCGTETCCPPAPSSENGEATSSANAYEGHSH